MGLHLWSLLGLHFHTTGLHNAADLLLITLQVRPVSKLQWNKSWKNKQDDWKDDDRKQLSNLRHK